MHRFSRLVLRVAPMLAAVKPVGTAGLVRSRPPVFDPIGERDVDYDAGT
jgi:hypothetical protein